MNIFSQSSDSQRSKDYQINVSPFTINQKSHRDYENESSTSSRVSIQTKDLKKSVLTKMKELEDEIYNDESLSRGMKKKLKRNMVKMIT